MTYRDQDKDARIRAQYETIQALRDRITALEGPSLWSRFWAWRERNKIVIFQPMAFMGYFVTVAFLFEGVGWGFTMLGLALLSLVVGNALAWLVRYVISELRRDGW